MSSTKTGFHLFEASIESLLTAMSEGAVTSVELTSQYLNRIGAFDRSGVRLNAVPILNPNALEEAAESDRRIAAGEARPLEGIPFTVKDSYMVEGLTVASGSPAFKDLIAQWDAFSVRMLREAGAVLIGKTNMPPMADGGMQRGVYGRAESPYNPHFLAAAYASGSSNGSGVSTAANMAVFGMGEETVSSGRSPASNNGLCAYTPSWGILSIRGNWPLFPARDVVVPQTRSMPDMLRLLDVLVQDDSVTRGDFWRNQSVISLPLPSEHRPETYLSLQNPDALRGKRLGIPKMYLGEDEAFPIRVRQSILELWRDAKARLEALGAEVIEVSFPLVEQYEGDNPGSESVADLGVLPEGWMDTEFNHFLGFGWDDFLRANGDPNIPELAVVDADQIFPRPAGSLPDRYDEVEDYDNRYRAVVALAKRGISDPRERPDFADGLRALEQLRVTLFENWLKQEGLDAVVFPANADVGEADADIDQAAADHAWENGVFYSNGNYPLRHLGIPTVTAAMGLMSDISMPVGLTFAGPAYSDPALLSYAYAFEAAGTLRPIAPFAPELPADRIQGRLETGATAEAPIVTLTATLDENSYHEGARLLLISGTVSNIDGGGLQIYVNGEPVLAEIEGETWTAAAVLPATATPPLIGGNPRVCEALVVAVATNSSAASGAFTEVS